MPVSDSVWADNPRARRGLYRLADHDYKRMDRNRQTGLLSVMLGGVMHLGQVGIKTELFDQHALGCPNAILDQ
jgi:hypothetical protein